MSYAIIAERYGIKARSLRIMVLRAKIKDQEMENALLKKLKELRGVGR